MTGTSDSAPDGLFDRRLIFVTGKGGVGKTTVAAGLALLGARTGRRTLVCEFDEGGDLADFVSSGPLEFEPTEVQPGLFAMAMRTEESLKEYLRLQLRLPLLARIGPLARTLDFVARAAPGVREILTVGKVAWEVKERRYDLVIVDASASGHVVAQLSAPDAINDLVKVGLVRGQTRWMMDLLADPSQTGVVVVSTPEEMPVVETLELIERLEATEGAPVAAVVLNRMIPARFDPETVGLLGRLREPAACTALEHAVSGPVTPLLDGADLAIALHQGRAEHADRLRAGLDPTLPTFEVPYLFTRHRGARATRLVADALAAQVDGS